MSPTTTQTTASKPRIRRIAEHRYLVESHSRPGLGRQVDTLRLKCTCPASAYQRRCWHLVYALQYEAWRQQQVRLAQVPPTPAVPTPVAQTAEPVALSSYFE